MNNATSAPLSQTTGARVSPSMSPSPPPRLDPVPMVSSTSAVYATAMVPLAWVAMENLVRDVGMILATFLAEMVRLATIVKMTNAQFARPWLTFAVSVAAMAPPVSVVTAFLQR